jgi:nucleotide-binding universal stress UspA family protein
MSDGTVRENEGGLLVFGDDGSRGADVAWLWVCNHRWPGWRAEVLTSTPEPFPPASWDHAPEPAEWESPHPRRAGDSELAAVRHLSAAMDPRLLLGDRRDADLLVVGPRGLSRVEALMLGSTTEWLLHHPPAPMAVVRSAAPVRRAVVCVDGSVHAQAAVEAFARLPWASDSEATVLGVDHGVTDLESGQTRARRALEAAGVAVQVATVRGRPAASILDRAHETDAQLIVLGTRGLTGWKRLRLGSTAGTVVRAAGCSALVACADEGSDAGPTGERATAAGDGHA